MTQQDSLQVCLLHILQFGSSSGRVSSRSTGEMTHLLIGLDVPLRLLEILVDVFAKHLLEVTIVLLSGASTSLSTHVIDVVACLILGVQTTSASKALRDHALAKLGVHVGEFLRFLSNKLISLCLWWLASSWSGTSMGEVVIEVVGTRLWLIEPSNSTSESLKLSTSTWDIGWSFNPIHQSLLVILDARSPELTLGLTSIGISHGHLSLSGHEVLQHLCLLLGLLLLFLLLDRHLIVISHHNWISHGLLLSILTARVVSLIVLWDSFNVFHILVIVVIFLFIILSLLELLLLLLLLHLIKSLILHVVVSWSILHHAVNRGITISIRQVTWLVLLLIKA